MVYLDGFALESYGTLDQVLARFRHHPSSMSFAHPAQTIHNYHGLVMDSTSALRHLCHRATQRSTHPTHLKSPFLSVTL